MEIKKNNTSVFMVPTLNIGKENLLINGFINAYIRDESQEIPYKDAIYLLFRPTDINRFREFVDEEYERTDQVIEDYPHENGCIVIVYKLNPKFKKDFDLVRIGKYSLTSDKFQELFPKIIHLKKNGLSRDEISLQYRVFNRTEDLIKFWEDKLGVIFKDDQEVWDGFDEKNEVLNLDKIKEYV